MQNRNMRYAQFVDSGVYPLFKLILEDQILSYFEKIKSSNDKEDIWLHKKSIDTLNNLLSSIEDISVDKEENQDKED